MNNKNYIKSLINEMFDQNILNSEEDRNDMKSLICTPILTGNFEEDLEYLKALWEEEHKEAEEYDAIATAQEIEEVLDRLHVGLNVVGGLGAGYASNEEDLKKMKEFVRPILWAQVAFQKMFSYE